MSDPFENIDNEVYLEKFKNFFNKYKIVIITAITITIIVAITLVGIIKYKQIPNLTTIFGLTLIVVGVVIVNVMNNTNIDN